jgi:hypothetical protein
MPLSHDEPPQPPESPDEYPLSPEEPPPEVPRVLPEPVIDSGEPAKDTEANQFTLSELLWLVAIAAVLMSTISSITRWTKTGNSPASLTATYAAILGIATLASMVVLALLPPLRRIVTVGWWVLLSLYVVAAVAAVLMSQVKSVP